MLLKEFTDRTGYKPAQEEYEMIERIYYKFDGDKNEFCKAWNCDAAAKVLDVAVKRMASMKSACDYYEELLNGLKKENQRLQDELEKEKEWRPYEDKDNVKQADYEELAKYAGRLSDEEAKNLLYRQFGFAKEKIEIHHTVPVYKINRHKKIKKVGEITRHPLYAATDMNYIRFDCGCMSYELYNDDLLPYLY